MQSGKNLYLHHLSVKAIFQLLKFSAWQTENQSITSAVTNDNQLLEPDSFYQEIGENTSGPNAFSDITFTRPIKRILDVGGGKFDFNRDYMKKKHIDLLVWDPFNRSAKHNENVQVCVNNEKVDAATSMSVLNVIPEVEARLAHITTLKTALRDGGYAYFKIWAGDAPFNGSYFPTQTPTVYQANAKAPRFFKEIALVFGIDNVWLDQTTPNLIIAKKVSEELTSKEQIYALRATSFIDEQFVTKKINAFIQSYYSQELRVGMKNYALFQEFTDIFLEKNKMHDDSLQREFDKKHGLIHFQKSKTSVCRRCYQV